MSLWSRLLPRSDATYQQMPDKTARLLEEPTQLNTDAALRDDLEALRLWHFMEFQRGPLPSWHEARANSIRRI